MADDITTTDTDAPEASVDEPQVDVTSNGPSVTPALPEIANADEKTVGDDTLVPREPTVAVASYEAPAQVAGVPDAPVETVKVHEVFVTTDTVITDTSSPLAVQIPDAGRGSLDLPIHALDGPTVEQVFAASAE